MRRYASTSARHVRVAARRVVSHGLTAVLLAFCFISLLLLLVNVSYLFALAELGYGDSYVLYDVVSFQRTGAIYRDLSQPPYVPSVYGPMVYMLYSLPGRLGTWENLFVGPRLIALASFMLCVGTVVSIVRVLVPNRLAWVWGLLLACSISVMWNWVLQIRGDFAGMFFSLLAMRLLLAGPPWAVLLAGISAGFAMQFKTVFVAAITSGALWLLIQRRWKELMAFAGGGLMSSAGLYVLLAAREPRMLAHMSAFSKLVPDVRGCLEHIWEAAREPVVPLAMLGLSPTPWSQRPGLALLGTFAIISFGIAAVTDVHAGGNVNYFYESLFALIPLATLGVFHLTALARRRVAVAAFVGALFSVHFVGPRAVELYGSIHDRWTTPMQARNNAFLEIERALKGYRVFSTVSRLSLLDPSPVVTEPFALSYLSLLDRFDFRPILSMIDNQEFDVVITPREPQEYRGVPLVVPALDAAILASYKPECLALGSLVLLPRRDTPRTAALAANLPARGCVPIAPQQAKVPRQ